MLKKIFLVGIIVAIVAISIVIVTAEMPALIPITQQALNSTSNMTNYPGFEDAVNAAPIWIYVIPVVVGGVLVVLVLRAKEKPG